MICINNIDLIRKIHSDADDTCFSSILHNWEEKTQYEILEKLMSILCKGVDMKTAVKTLDIDEITAKKLLKNCEHIEIKHSTKCLYDHMLCNSKFLKECETLIENRVEDVYFSLNSFYIPEKSGSNIRHINAFVLDFDYYKDERFKDWSPERFYTKKIKSKLHINPTAVVDSGRGLYVIYAFKHCSYHVQHLYKAILKTYHYLFKDLALDAGAMLLTQVIRMPGSINSKSGKVVRILEYSDTDYLIQDFVSILPWSYDDVKDYRLNKQKETKGQTINKRSNKNISKRKPYYKGFHDDLRKLIIMRNRKGEYDGYRENLLYLARERAIWSGYSIDESVTLALELNNEFKSPLSNVEVEKVCKPSSGRKNSSLETIIKKLNITQAEQRKLKVIKHKWIKKSEYAKQRRKVKLTNLTEKQQKVLERRTRVCELKNRLHLSNKHIADILGVNKSTVTRDLKEIQSNPARFKIKLKDYMDDILSKRESKEFKLRQTYDRQIEIIEWFDYAKSALDYLIRELDVAVN